MLGRLYWIKVVFSKRPTPLSESRSQSTVLECFHILKLLQLYSKDLRDLYHQNRQPVTLRKDQVDIILLDFSKAFEKVPHQRLLHKLDYYGVRGDILRWIQSFLGYRKQQVLLERVMSAEAEVISGVPQGTVLGPLLFLAFINDLLESTASDTRLFADDALLYHHIGSSDDAKQLQQDLDVLQQ